MAENICTVIATTPVVPTTEPAGSFRFLPIDRLRTSYAALRPGAPRRVPEDVAQLPIRVVPTEEGVYEVIDGFKRLAGWREQGHHLIPTVVEPPGTSAEHKRLLLAANAPPRTLTALDEARVVCSLMSDEGLSPGRIARSLGHKPHWVARRVDIGTRLSPVAQNKLAQGSIGPTLAHALCAVPQTDQDALLGVIQRHALKLREALALLSAYRVADEAERRELLRTPLTVARPQPPSSPAISPTTTVLERRLEHIREALVDLAGFTIPDELAPVEKRRLQARLHSVLAQLQDTVCAQDIDRAIPNPKGDEDEPEPRTPRQHSPHPSSSTETRPGQDPGAAGDSEPDRRASQLLRQQGDRSPGGLFPQDRSSGVGRARVPARATTNRCEEQARSIPPSDPRKGHQTAHRHPDSARDPRAGLHGRQEHSRRVCANPAVTTGPSAAQERQTSLRNSSG